MRDTKLSEDVLISLFMKELLRPLMGLSYIGPSKLVRLALDWKPDSGPREVCPVEGDRTG